MLIKEFMATVTLYNGNRNGIHHLIGGKSLTARGALAATLDAGALVDWTGVKHAGILAVAKWTFHIFFAFPNFISIL